ncbi:MAG: serine hydrolase, partial [Solirubrobacterales bacterium]
VGAAGCGPSEGPRVAAADPPATTVERAASEPAAKPDRGGHGPRKLPSAAGLHSAKGYAADREGVVSLATVNSDGRLRGYRENRRYASASVVKAMLLAAEMRRLKHAGQAVDSSTDSVLTAMITISDNGAADTIYNRVGDAGLNAVAKRAGMTRFTVAGYWGNAQIAAADMARFFGDLDRQFPRRFREYAKGLLGSVTESQSWGIPAVAGKRWAVRFKGGWLPDHALVHQAAELRERKGARELAIVVLTDAQPSFTYGIETVRGVAERLLSRDGDP